MELQRLGASLHCAGTESRESRETGSYTTCTTCTTCTRIYFLCCYATLVSCLGSGRRDRCGCSAASPHRSANAPGCQGRLLTGTVLQRLTDRHSHTGGGGGPSSRVAPTTDWQQFPGEGGGAARTCYRQGPPRLPLTSAAQRPAVLGYCCCCGALLRLAGGPVLAPRARPRSHRHGPAARADRRCTLQQGTRGDAWRLIPALSLHHYFKQQPLASRC